MSKYKIKTLESYCRHRNFSSQGNTYKIRKETASGKMAHEYFELLKFGANSPSQGLVEYLKKCEDLKR